jgi:hypothetical protein
VHSSTRPMNAPSKFWIHACSKIMSCRNNYVSWPIPLVHCTVCAQIAPVAINTGVRSNPIVPFTSAAISILLEHTNAISCNLVNHHLGFFPLTPMASSRPKMFQKSIEDESEIRKLIHNHFLSKWEGSDGDRLMGKISLHWIPMTLWCYLPFFNADSTYPLVNSSVASFIITRSS